MKFFCFIGEKGSWIFFRMEQKKKKKGFLAFSFGTQVFKTQVPSEFSLKSSLCYLICYSDLESLSLKMIVC